MQLLKIINTILIIFEIFLCVGGFIGFQITFGHGLGDFLDFAFLYALTITHIVWSIKIRKSSSKSFILPVLIFFLTSVIFSLKATIWRGGEYSWKNRKLFYGHNENVNSVTSQLIYEITINGKTKYISLDDPKNQFTVTLKVSKDRDNNQIANIDSGKLLLPDTLKEFSKNVDYNLLLLQGQNPFEKDSTLKTIIIAGRIIGIKENKFIFFVDKLK